MDEYITQPILRIFKSKAYLGCVIFLLACAIGLQAAVNMLGVYLTKKPIELQMSLDDLDDTKIYSYKVIDKSRIASKEVEEALGTEEYIQWWLEDEREPDDSPFKKILVFVTYYTGDEYTVPHTPEVCGAGSGAIPQIKGIMPIKVSNVGAKDDVINVKMLDLILPQQPQYVHKVAYFFSANGDYLYGRNQVRFRMNDLKDKYAYFAKIEFSVFGKVDEVTDEAMLAKVERLSRRLLPELVKNHFPEWPPVEPGQEIDKE